MENFLEINKWVYPFIRDLRVKFVDSHFPLSTPHFFPVHKLFDKLFPKFKPAFFSETKNQQFPITGSLIGSLNQELILIANYSCIKLCEIFIPLYSTLYCDFIVQGIYLSMVDSARWQFSQQQDVRLWPIVSNIVQIYKVVFDQNRANLSASGYLSIFIFNMM